MGIDRLTSENHDLSPVAAGPLTDRIAALDLGAVELEAWEDVDDPAGADIDVFIATAQDIASNVASLAARLIP